MARPTDPRPGAGRSRRPMENQQVTDETEAAQAEREAAPQRVRVQLPYGFLDDAGRSRNWKAGEVVADPAEVALLRDRGAPIEVI